MTKGTGEWALIVLSRYPRPGRVKSRLASTLGEESAVEIARLAAERLFAESRRLPNRIQRYLFVADEADLQATRRWAGTEFHLRAQASGDFGRRMAESLRTAFAEGARKAVIVGSDIPDLSASIVQEAFRLLEHYPLVIGPDEGGGYYLLGMKMLYGDLFDRELAWGSNRVLGQTLRIMERLDLVPFFLPPLIDVDTEGDARRWLERQAGAEDEPLVDYLRRRFNG